MSFQVLNNLSRVVAVDAVRACARTVPVLLAILGLAPASAGAQPFSVVQFSPWAGYKIPNGIWLTGYFNDDKWQDILHAVEGSDSVAHVWISDGAGKYTVSTFRPWPGYKIPNGVWLTGDFNGDGWSDVFHGVEGSDAVAHVWTSDGRGGFAVTAFQPWPGYKIPNGVWLTGNFDADNRTDVLHAVEGTDVAHLWTSLGGGAFDVSTFRPWPGYKIPNGIWLTGNFAGDGRTDIFHGVEDAGIGHLWTASGVRSFTVSTFAPWPGYKIPNGVWLVGDFNDDSSSDLFHAVEGGDVAHVWTSRGGSFSVTTFRPWPGYLMPNGVWLPGDFDRDGKTDVLHAVAGTDLAHFWRSLGGGNFSIINYSPWAGYKIPNGLWLAADITADRKTDIVHAVEGTDYVNSWIAGTPAPDEVSVDGIEVTQAIQNMPHEVPLVANKPTFARAYLSAGAQAPTNVRGEITVRNTATGASTTVQSTAAIMINPAQHLQVRPKREALNASLNFPIPAGFTVAAPLNFNLTAVREATTGAAVACGNCNVPRGVTIVDSAPLRLRSVALRYTAGTPPTFFLPTLRDFDLLDSWLRRAYPVGQLLGSRAIATFNVVPPFTDDTCNVANAQLAAMRAREVDDGTVDARAHYIGLVANGGGFMRGCAPTPGNVASGPTGPTATGNRPANVTGDTDGSFGDWYGGHELGHSFDREHPGFCNRNSRDDRSFPYPNGQISPDDGSFTGFDVGDVQNGIPTTVLPGASRFDIMTYCNQPQWPSAYMYEGTRDRLNEEETEAALTGGLAANGAASPVAAGPKPSRKEPPPVRTGRDAAPPPVRGRESAPAAQPASPSPPPVRRLAAQPPAARPALAGAPPVDRGPRPDAPPPAAMGRSVEPVAAGDFVSIVATVNLTRGTAQMRYVQRVSRAAVSGPPPDRRASIRLEDAAGQVIGEHPVRVREDSDTENRDRTALIDAIIPYAPRIAKIDLILEGRVADTRRVTAQPPVVSKVKIEPHPESALFVHWQGKDPDRDELTYMVQVRAASNKPWETIAIGLTKPKTVLTAVQIQPYLGGELRVIANDGFNSSAPVQTPLP